MRGKAGDFLQSLTWDRRRGEIERSIGSSLAGDAEEGAESLASSLFKSAAGGAASGAGSTIFKDILNHTR